MKLTPQQKTDLRAALHSAIGAGMDYGVPEGSPPLPPTRERINQAAYWAMSEVERALTRKRWTGQKERDRLYEENRRLRAVIEAVSCAGSLEEVGDALEA